MRYDQMVEDALRGVVRKAVEVARSEGLSGDHHFYLTFLSHHGGVVMPEYLREQYPEEMTIVLQHQFYELEVDDRAFSVTLSFNSKKERLCIPFEAITTFADPSVNFALHFQKTAGVPEDRQAGPEGKPSDGSPGEAVTALPSSGIEAKKKRDAPKLVEADAEGSNPPSERKDGESEGEGPEKVVILDHFRNNKES